MYSQYNGNLCQLVHMIGDINLNSQILERINDSDFFNYSNYSFKIMSEINILPKSEVKSSNTVTEGLLSSEWIEKRTNTIPSIVIYSLDWSIQIQGIDWKDRETNLLMEANKFKDILRFRNIKLILIIFLGKNSNYALGIDDKISNLKKNLEIENSKFIFLLPGHLELIAANKKKIQKTIEEISLSYYSDYLKKLKKKITKNIDIFSQENNLRAQLKTGILNEIIKKNEKSLKYYKTSYEITKILLKYYTDQANISIKENDLNSLIQNYDFLIRTEEIRYISDLIVFRMIQVCVLKLNFVEAFLYFDQHYKYFKNKINFFDSRLLFEEYKWRSDFVKNFALILLKEYNNNKKILIEKNFLYRFCNLFHMPIFCSEKRIELIQENVKDYSIFLNIGNHIKKVRPLFFGRTLFKPIYENNPLEKTDTNKKTIKYSIYYRIYEELNRKSAEENIELLRKVEKLTILDEKELIINSFYLVLNYIRNDAYDNVLRSSNELLKLLSLKKWNTLSIYICETLLDASKVRGNYFEIARYELELLISKNENDSNKKDRIENIINSFYTIEKETKIENKLIDNKFIKILAEFSGSSNYYEKTKLIVKIQLPDYLEKFFKYLSISFNNIDYNLQEDLNNFEKKNNFYYKEIDIMLNKTVPNDTLIINELNLIAELKNKNNLIHNVIFKANTNFINFSGIEPLFINQAPNSLDVKLKNYSEVFIQEEVNLKIIIEKIPKLNDKISNLQIFLYDYDLDSTPQRENCLIYLYEKETSNYKEYHNDKPMFISLVESIPIDLNFIIKLNSEGEKKFTLFLRYNLQRENLGIIERDMTKKFNLRVINPFIIKPKVKIMNHYYNSMNKHENPLKPIINLPLRKRSNIIFQISPQNCDFILNSLKMTPILSPNFNLLSTIDQEPNISILKNETYAVNLMIYPNQLCEDLSFGSLSIQWRRLDSLDITKNNIISIPLPSLSIEDKPFEIDLDVNDLCEFGDIINVSLRITNKIGYSQKLIVSMIENPDFLVAGDIRKNILLDHKGIAKFDYKIIALGIGKKKLPALQIINSSLEGKNIWESGGTRIITIIPKK